MRMDSVSMEGMLRTSSSASPTGSDTGRSATLVSNGDDDGLGGIERLERAVTELLKRRSIAWASRSISRTRQTPFRPYTSNDPTGYMSWPPLLLNII